MVRRVLAGCPRTCTWGVWRVPCSQVGSRPSGGPLLRVSAPSLLSGSPALSAPVLPSEAQFISSFTQPDWSSQSAFPYLFSRAAPSGHRETGTRPPRRVPSGRCHALVCRVPRLSVSGEAAVIGLKDGLEEMENVRLDLFSFFL